MKAVLRIGCFTAATLLLMGASASADQVTYDLIEAGGSGAISNSHPTFLNEIVLADIGTYQFSGSVNPAQTGLIGVSSGFRAAVSRFVPGFTPDGGGGPIGGGMDPDSDTGGGPPLDFPSTQWTRITIDTSATGSYQTLAAVNGLSATNNIGYVKFDWLVTGTSNIFLDAGEVGPMDGEVNVQAARSVATLRVGGDMSLPDTFIHDPTRGPSGSVNDLAPAVLQAESFLVPFDFTQLNPGEVPLINVDFQLAVETRLDITNVDDLGNFEALFDANFSNTARLTKVTVLDSNQVPISGTSVIDSVTLESLVAVPEPSSAVLLALAGCAGFIRRRRHTA